MFTTRRWLSIGLTFFLLLPLEAVPVEDSLWQRINSEARQLARRDALTKGEKVSLLALAEAEKFGPQDYRVAVSLNELAALISLAWAA